MDSRGSGKYFCVEYDNKKLDKRFGGVKIDEANGRRKAISIR